MADRGNFLIGYGERLASDIAAPLGGAPKQHPYTFAESRRRLTPKVKAAVRELEGLPRVDCCSVFSQFLLYLTVDYIATIF